MKNIKLILFLIIYSFLIDNSKAIENKILFKVNSEIITSLDILTEIRYLEMINQEFKKTQKKQAFEIAKRSLIREKIKKIELKKNLKEIKVEEKLINKIIIDYFNKFQINSINEFEEYFSSIEIDPRLIRKKITIELLWNELIFKRFNQNIKIDKKLIEKNIKSTNNKREFLLSEILFSLEDKEKLDKKYKLIENSIEKTNFAQSALLYSISSTAQAGGKLGWINETVFNTEINNVIKNMKIGDYSKPIVIPGGFLILKIENIRKSNDKIDLEKEIKKIVDKRTNEQLNQFSNIYFNKIKKNIIINEL
jgi:peptidyl-prolyl cis-trans isomerase SurA